MDSIEPCITQAIFDVRGKASSVNPSPVSGKPVAMPRGLAYIPRD